MTKNIFNYMILHGLIQSVFGYQINLKGKKLESNINKKFNSVYITLNLPAESNQLLSESALRSNRKKIQEATLRLEDHLNKFRSISELNYAIPLDEVGE